MRISKQAHEWQEERVQGDHGKHGEVQLQVIRLKEMELG